MHAINPQPPLRPQPTQSVQHSAAMDQVFGDLGGRGGRSVDGSVPGQPQEAWCGEPAFMFKAFYMASARHILPLLAHVLRFALSACMPTGKRYRSCVWISDLGVKFTTWHHAIQRL